jgi:predicted anti-sigma-YlaC factor YlaD
MKGGAGLDCRKASKLLSAAGERSLTRAELKTLEHHLGLCLHCRNFDTQLKFLHKAAKRYRTGT